MRNKEIPRVEAEQEREKSYAELLRSIEIESGAGGSKPHLALSEFGEQGMSSLDAALSSAKEVKEDKEPMVVAIVRCWNKSATDLKEFIERVRKIKENIPGLQGVFLSVNQEGDKGGVTEKNLQELLAESPEAPVPIIPLSIENYTWTSGLNSATAVLNELCLRDGVGRDDVRVMNLSFDTDLDPEELKKTDQLIKERDYVFTARKTSTGESPFEGGGNGKTQGEKIWEKFTEILRDPNSTDLSELAYSMRNTFNVIKLSDVVAMGGFNPMANGEARKFSPASPNPAFFYNYDARDVKVSIKGMEDAEFFMRLILNALKQGDISVLKEFRKSFDEPVLYEDKSWDKLGELKKIRKISNEMIALSLILSGMATKEYSSTARPGEKRVTGLVKDFYVPKAMQDFYLRR